MVKRPKRLLDKRRLKPVLMFLISFNILSIPLYLLVAADFSFQPLQALIARMTAVVLNSLGYGVGLDSQHILTAAGDSLYDIDVSWDSTGWKSMYALFALVIASPISGIGRKLRFLSIGLPAIFLLNLARISTTIIIALELGFQYFDVVHTLLWREGLILAVVAVWYLWLRSSMIIRKK